jgi:hypothetical protein
MIGALQFKHPEASFEKDGDSVRAAEIMKYFVDKS